MDRETLIDAEQIDGDFVAKPAESVAAVEMDQELVLLDEDTGSMHLLDPIGTVVWGCFDGTATISQLAVDLGEAFGAPPEQVESDVIELARSLGARGMLRGVRRVEDEEPEAASEETEGAPAAGEST